MPTKTALKWPILTFSKKKKKMPPDNVPKIACAKYLSIVTSRNEMRGCDILYSLLLLLLLFFIVKRRPFHRPFPLFKRGPKIRTSLPS